VEGAGPVAHIGGVEHELAVAQRLLQPFDRNWYKTVLLTLFVSHNSNKKAFRFTTRFSLDFITQ
jgi:hypothetical protein